MHTFNFLIAAISTAAIAKPLPDAQTGSSFGYFPSNFGAEEIYKSLDQWGGTIIQRPDSNDPEVGNPAPVQGGAPDNGDSSPISGSPDNGYPSPVSNAPAERDPTSYHTTTEHPPGISPAFRYFREFWCGAFEGREQTVCCLGNEYGTFRSFAGELPCEKKQWVLGAGTETIGFLDIRFRRYCHTPSYFYSCNDYYVRILPLPP